MRRASPRIDIGDISTANGIVSFFVRDTSQLDAAVEATRRLTNPVGVTVQPYAVTPAFAGASRPTAPGDTAYAVVAEATSAVVAAASRTGRVGSLMPPETSRDRARRRAQRPVPP